MPSDGSQRFIRYLRDRSRHIPKNDAYFIAGMGFVTALLLLPVLRNLNIPMLLARFGLPVIPLTIIFVLIAPIGLLTLAYLLVSLPFQHTSAAQLSRYAVIGCFNVALNAAIFNSLILISGISIGPMVTLFAVVTFVIVVTQSFFWSAFWTFRNMSTENRRYQYVRFFAVSSVVTIVNIGIIQVMVNVIGAPYGIPTALWANIALLCTIFTALLGNFLGYKRLVFAR